MGIVVTALVVPAIFATLALPAYAAVPKSADVLASEQAEASEATITKLTETGAQEVTVGTDVAAAATARDAVTVVSGAEMRRLAAAAAMTAVRKAYSGPSTAQLLANPPYPSFSLDQVVAVAMQYQGVPYAYGGGTPAGFDCSGFTAFVYANFGIALPHSGTAQGRLGTAIAPSAALPGDIVVIDGGAHVGIYLGGNMMIDAPYRGRTVSVNDIYSSNHFFVRFGI